MNGKMILYMLGKIMLLVGALMVLPLVTAVIYGENTLWFLLPMLVFLALGWFFSSLKSKNTNIYAKEGFIIVALAWIVTSLFGAAPFVISGYIPSFVDAFFESVSGFTTTGSSILTNVEALPYSLLLWRSFTHWIGGMGVLVFVMMLMPKSASKQSMHILRAEMPGPQVDKLVSKARDTARILYGIYIVLTVAEVIALCLSGLPFFDSLVNSFATAGTGGFSVKALSIASYANPVAEVIIGIFMIVFGMNFNLFYLILTGNIIKVLKSEELNWYLAIIGVSTIIVTLNISDFFGNFGDALRAAFFQVSSIITTTGFSSVDFDLWPTLSKTILITLMFFGACGGSTGGGIKISRVVMLLKSFVYDIKKQISPRSVFTLKFEGNPVEDAIVQNTKSYLVVYAIVFFCSLLIISVDNFSFFTNFSAVASCFNNIGPGFEAVGPLCSFADYSDLSKLVLAFDMLAGRLELLPMVVLFSPSTWKRG